MKLLLLSLVLPLTAFAHPGHQHADWIASLTHNPAVIVLSLLGVALLGAPVLARFTSRDASRGCVFIGIYRAIVGLIARVQPQQCELSPNH